MSETFSTEGAARQSPSVGTLLSRARQARGMSVAQLARQLKLDNRMVTALEADDYEALPPALYVKGYLRAIGNLLGTDTEELLAVYHRDCDRVADPELAGFASRPAVQLTSSSPRVRTTTVILIVTLAVLVGIWWQANELMPDAVRPIASGNDDASPIKAEPAASTMPVVEPDTVDLLLSDEANLDPQYGDDHAPSAALDENAFPGEAESGPAVVEPLVDLQADSLVPASLADPTPGAIAETGPQDITLNVSAEAWIEITDAQGDRLFYDLGKPGQRISVSGVPPYRLIIGNAPGVELRYRNTPVDLGNHSSRGIARVTLGADSITADSAIE